MLNCFFFDSILRKFQCRLVSLPFPGSRRSLELNYTLLRSSLVFYNSRRIFFAIFNGSINFIFGSTRESTDIAGGIPPLFPLMWTLLSVELLFCNYYKLKLIQTVASEVSLSICE